MRENIVLYYIMKYTRKGESAKRKMRKNKSRVISKKGGSTNGNSKPDHINVNRTRGTNATTIYIDTLKKKIDGLNLIIREQTQGTTDALNKRDDDETALKKKINELEESVKTLNNKNNELETRNNELKTRNNELDSKIAYYIGLYNENDKAQTDKVNLVVNGINQISNIIKKLPELNKVCGSETINPNILLTMVNN